MPHHLHQTILEAEKKILEDFLSEQTRVIEGRKLISEFLLFISCQTLSASLAILLFQFTFKVWVLTWLCYLIGLAPSLPELCEIHIGKNPDNNTTEITIMRKPGKFLFKLIFGIGFTYIGIKEVRDSVKWTYEGLVRVQQEIQTYETPKTNSYEWPVEPTALLIATALIGAFLFWKGKIPD